jgi:threonine dehydratase
MADLSTCLPLTRESAIEAHKVIKPLIHLTPVMSSATLNKMASTPKAGGVNPAKPVIRLWFKCENLQRIGAFKARGAFYAIEKLKQDPTWLEGGGMQNGVVGFSSGMSISSPAILAPTHPDFLTSFCRQPCASTCARGKRERSSGLYCNAGHCATKQN